MQYRAEIDGLRALAVVAVILFHAGFKSFSGGFIGVDIFFVISGYLITTILINDIEHGRFSILNFYERRARRILPALFFVMLACIPFAWMWMLPDPLENFGQSIVATTIFSNNVLLYITAGYWDLGTDFKPLLHTWSLGVEEQYYVLFPLFLVFAFRFARSRVFCMVIVLALASLALSEWSSRNMPMANFYLGHTRAWELLAGSLTSFIAQKQGVHKNNFLSLLGMAAIIFSIFIYDENTPFPSIFALVPVMGTVLIVLFAGNNTIIARLLSTKPIVGVGLISYSAYLWHQPLFAFSKIYLQSPPSTLFKIALLVGVFVFAIGSWKFIESPFRKHSTIPSRSFFTCIIGFSLFFSFYGYWLHSSQGAPERIFTDYEFSRSNHDVKVASLDSKNYLKNSFLDLEQPKLLIYGDSFAGDIGYLFSYYYPDIDFRILNSLSASPNSMCNKDFSREKIFNQIAILIIAFDEGYNIPCLRALIDERKANGQDTLFVGTKNFGENLNWLTRLKKTARSSLCQKAAQRFALIEKRDLISIPSENYISMFSLAGTLDCIPITNSNGELLASDRKHFTVAGVEFFAPLFFHHKNIDRLMLNSFNSTAEHKDY